MTDRLPYPTDPDAVPDCRTRRPRIPVSSYAQIQARQTYYARNRAALILRQKMYRAGIELTTAECRAMVR